MKKFFKIFGIIVLVVVVLLVGGFIYFNAAFPDTEPPSDVKVEITQERLDRGKYLAMNVVSCIDCHSQRDWTKFSGPLVEGTLGMGGEEFGKAMGLPGRVTSKNITPAAIGDWTDGELIRAITCGVNKDGEALFPLMPYENFNHFTKEDLYSIVAYIRSLKPIENEVPETKLDFPVNYIVKTIPPEKYTPSNPIDKSNTVEYGKYITKIASCADCHTQAVEGEPVEGMYLAGGMEFRLPAGTVRSANLTPHESGLKSWTKEKFINRFKAYHPDSTVIASVSEDEFNTVMPWTMYAEMKTEDLGAIYEYLRTVEAVKNDVVRFTPREK